MRYWSSWLPVGSGSSPTPAGRASPSWPPPVRPSPGPPGQRHDDAGMIGQVRQLVKWTAAAADAVRRTDGLVILVYHRVGGRTPVSVDLPRPLFAEQLAVLAGEWAPTTLDRAADLLAAPAAPSGPPAVCVTFDDGTADFVD